MVHAVARIADGVAPAVFAPIFDVVDPNPFRIFRIGLLETRSASFAGPLLSPRAARIARLARRDDRPHADRAVEARLHARQGPLVITPISP